MSILVSVRRYCLRPTWPGGAPQDACTRMIQNVSQILPRNHLLERNRFCRLDRDQRTEIRTRELPPISHWRAQTVVATGLYCSRFDLLRCPNSGDILGDGLMSGGAPLCAEERETISRELCRENSARDIANYSVSTIARFPVRSIVMVVPPLSGARVAGALRVIQGAAEGAQAGRLLPAS
jgi:hypothetical protein